MSSATQELVTLPEAVTRRGISEAKWRVLFNLYPGAKPDSALMVWDYCQARNLDPMKKPCHIVQMDYKDAGGTWQKRDVVMPGIYEYRITAHRTRTYLGHSKPEFGPIATIAGVDAPEFCDMTFYRWHAETSRVIEFAVTVFFAEAVATNREGNANARWTKAPRQMLTKCTEAAGLREGWPEEFGGEPTAEEMDGQRPILDVAEVVAETMPKPAQRKSEQAPPVPPATAQTPGMSLPPAEPADLDPQPDPPATAPAGSPANIGVIDEIKEKAGVFAIRLGTGFIVLTKDEFLARKAQQHMEAKTMVDLSSKAPSDPAKYRPTLTGITVIGDVQ